MGVSLKDVAKVVGLATQAAPLVGGLFKKKKKDHSYKPESPYRDAILLEMAKQAAERAGKNASVAPQLLFADFMFVLVDAVDDGRILLQVPQLTEVEG